MPKRTSTTKQITEEVTSQLDGRELTTAEILSDIYDSLKNIDDNIDTAVNGKSGSTIASQSNARAKTGDSPFGTALGNLFSTKGNANLSKNVSGYVKSLMSTNGSNNKSDSNDRRSTRLHASTIRDSDQIGSRANPMYVIITDGVRRSGNRNYNYNSTGSTASAGNVLDDEGGIDGLLKGFADFGQLLNSGLNALVSAGLDIITSSFGTLFKNINNRGQKLYELDMKRRQYAIDRLNADLETVVKRPFEILEKAAQSIYDAWDSNIRVINATQGYDKAGLQDLMASFAQRLRDEGLSSVVSGAELTQNLTRVLEAGLSGKIAEEFAYQATRLNAAIPTQDFFGYVSAYASVAANAVRAGKSQADAIQMANDSLEEFASGLLYASRELSGGFTTGLKDASTVYEQAVKIAQAGRTDNIDEIASVLLAVRGDVGAVAPDLASSITDTIYKLLTGGNSADLVALRSLAGINASNTEFLRSVAQNPQLVFSTLFANLAQMYTDSADAYMEKAEGYAQLFGLTSEAFQRIDFNALATSIARMNMSDASLAENMDLLVEGQTTTNDEQLKIQQINKFMIEEGLAYVMDNEAARAIQQHMWDEQRTSELLNNEYTVLLAGEGLEIMKSMHGTIVGDLSDFFSGLFSGREDEWGDALKSDIHEILTLGVVGNGNQAQLERLLGAGEHIYLHDTLATMMGGQSELFEYIKANFAASLRRRNLAEINAFLDNEGYQYGWASRNGSAETVSAQFESAMNSLGAQRESIQQQIDLINERIDAGGYTTGGGGMSGARNYSVEELQQQRDKLYEQLADVERKFNESVGYAVNSNGIINGLMIEAMTSADSATATAIGDIVSRYSWGSLGKSVLNYLNLSKPALGAPTLRSTNGVLSTSQSAAIASSVVEEFLSEENIRAMANEGLTYSGMLSRAMEQGIDLQSEVESRGGTMDQLMQYYVGVSAEQDRLREIETLENQRQFYEVGIAFMQEEFPNNFQNPLFELLEIGNSRLVDIIARQDSFADMYRTEWLEKSWITFVSGNGQTGDGLLNKFFNEFMNYFVNHTYYSETSGYTYADVEDAQQRYRENERGDTITALADVLRSNLLDLSDPTMQTNALLAQILVFVEAIKNQGDGVDIAPLSLPETLFGLATTSPTASSTDAGSFRTDRNEGFR